MLNLATINSLKVENLFLLDAESLAMPEVIDKLNRMAVDPQLDLEPAQAWALYDGLESLVKDRNDLNEGVVNSLSPIFLRLFWKSLPAMPVERRNEALSKNLIDSLISGAQIKDCLQKILDVYEFGVGPDKETRRGWIYSLEHNQEKLGAKAITLDTGTAQPTIENWLKAYNLLQPLGKKREAFNEITYLNRSKDVSQLSAQDREALKKILEIYDWLLFPPPGPEVIPDEHAPKTDQATPYIQAKKFELPKNLLQNQAPKDQGLVPPQRPPANLSKPVEQSKPVANSPIRTPQARPVNIQEILKRREQQLASENSLPPTAKLSPKPGQSEIDKKLEDLKKRRSA